MRRVWLCLTSLPTASIRYTHVISPLNFLFSMISNPCSLSIYQVLQSLSHLCGPLLDMLQYVCICLERQLKKQSLVCEKNGK